MRRSMVPISAVSAAAVFFFLGLASRADEAFERIGDAAYVDDHDVRHLADVYVPRGDGPFPGVLMVHGGAWRLGSKLHMVGHARLLAEHGYTVVNINYRLAPQHKFPAQIEDCKAAVRWMRRNAEKYKIDPQRIAGYGYSAGAHLVSLLGVTDRSDGLEGAAGETDAPSTRLQAVVAGGTPCDFQWVPNNGQTMAYFLGGTREEKPEVYRQASPVSFVTQDDPPIFFFHGEADNLVPRAGVDRMMKLLAEAKVPAELYALPDKGHITAFLDQEAQQQALKFLDKVLKAER